VTCYDKPIRESCTEILGHAEGGITHHHYAHRDPLAFRAIMTIPHPMALLALVKVHDGEGSRRGMFELQTTVGDRRVISWSHLTTIGLTTQRHADPDTIGEAVKSQIRIGSRLTSMGLVSGL
jgi:hypothetical protein